MADVCGLDPATSASLMSAISPQSQSNEPPHGESATTRKPVPPPRQPPRTSSSAAALAHHRGKRRAGPPLVVRINSNVEVGNTSPLDDLSDVGESNPETTKVTSSASAGESNPCASGKVPKIPGWHKVVAMNEKCMASRGWLPHATPQIASGTTISSNPSNARVSPASPESVTSSPFTVMTGHTSTVSLTSRAATKSNYTKLVRQREVQTARAEFGEYEGQYSEPYKTPFEREHVSKVDRASGSGIREASDAPSGPKVPYR